MEICVVRVRMILLRICTNFHELSFVVGWLLVEDKGDE